MPYLLHQLLSVSAALRPDAEAVRLVDEAMTYGELEARSNQLARALIETGVVPGDRVGIYLKKSPAAIVSIFGILKTGACYVPVDANAPGMRLVEIARQCGFRALITSGSLFEKIQKGLEEECQSAALFFVDELPQTTPSSIGHSLSQVLPQYPAEPPAVNVVDHDLAYILFTSGSTGTPKGVMLSHLNALTFVNWAVETFDISSDDRLSNHAPFNFDLSVFDIFVAIKAGAAISLVPEGLSVFPLQLASFIEKQKITVWYSVPMVLMLLLGRGKLEEGNLSSLRWVLFAGEVFPTKHLRTLMEKLPHPSYANLYGPTETNVCAYYEVKTLAAEATAPIPIGKACANTELIAIDEAGERVTRPGTEGLLYARGSTVMQGYYGRPENTNSAFIRNPFAVGREEKLYCTGDWVTLDDYGNYLFVGRKDHMIKTRGYRVELGEIEAVMVAHPAVDEAVALAVPDEAIGNAIQAVVTIVGNGSLDAAELKRHCAEKLPPYMIPEKIDFPATLPRTDNGKIDRRRLQSERMTPSA
ncbi:MAG: amino acid adenylation domain-containing protein [Chthoniobacterales bacterium]|nr:amino acid adenylation domain-containing protein [Chthoniobacterales bacterium]